MKIITCNVNGLRAAVKKGLLDYLKQVDADVICFQELKAQADQLASIKLEGYFHHYACAQQKGYSGVGILSKQKPNAVNNCFGYSLMDDEGRFLQLNFDRFSVASVYMPSGSYSVDRQRIKMELMNNRIKPWLDQMKYKPLIVCGDFNIAHTILDIKNAKGNQKNSGFLPEEREWMSDLFASGYVDAFRHIHPKKEQYTWWSNRGRAWENNVGWRIDYQLVSLVLGNQLSSAEVYTQKRFSDHAPLIVVYNGLDI